MRVNKSIKNFINFFLGPLLFAWLAFSIYQQIKNQPQLETSWLQIKEAFASTKIFYGFASLLLVPVNWGIEAWKWKLSVANIHPISFFRAFEAVLSGVSFSVTMPNRIGEYLGRMIYLPEGSRLKTISVTLVGSFSQLLVTLYLGFIGLIIIKKPLLENFAYLSIWYQFFIYGLAIIIILLTIMYFHASAVVELFNKWFKKPRYMYLVEALEYFHYRLLSILLLLSLLRYLVFIVQYIMIYYLFDVNLPFLLIGWVTTVVFLSLSMIPSIALVEVGVRGQVSLKLMGMFSSNSLGIGLASITIWAINLILPAIIGSLLLLNFKIFRKQGDTVI